ncbi:MGMT family protein [Glycomyces sp. NRRL B-16210]|uniref:restriction system modified-DNA reader domain-containing protein n=1 Tax=Glycomyces sp. NRRL B-16210 TaxID=1463821 RepID=UPI0018CBFB60|nr:MGMT family protein [Glycomyces sp. NRRL B-16210]
MVNVQISEHLYEYIKSHAIPFEDSVDSVLTRLLGLDGPETQQSPPPSPEAGVLAPLVKAGLLREGDQLSWRRSQKNITYTATVGPNGTMRLANGAIAASPSGAATMLAGGNHPGWDVWKQIQSGLTLSQLRAQLGGAEPVMEDDWISRLASLLDRIPKGYWTTYGTLGHLFDRHPREIGHVLASTKLPNPHRVLQHGGTVSPGFRWIDEDLGDPREMLRGEGSIPPDGDTAMRDRWLSAADLRKLMED